MTSLAQYLKQIDTQAKALHSLLPAKPEYEQKLKNKFRLEFNYNSNHLEGNTLTYGETELLLLFGQTEGEHEVREYDEMQAHDLALKMIETEALASDRPLTESFIRTLNQHLLVRPFWKEAITFDGQPTQKQIIPGKYKSSPNSVRLSNGEIFHYASPDEVPAKMQELVEWYNENSSKEHPVLLAALLHYNFVKIHPFDDGNGRVARLLMNYVMLKYNYPVIVIKSSDKKSYLHALNQADVGNIEAFTKYIAEQLLWSIDISIKALKGESIEEEEDLNKELELLKRELKQIPDTFDKKRSEEILHETFEKSLLPLAQDFNQMLNSVSDLFAHQEINIKLGGANKRSSFKNSYTLEQLEKIYSESTPFKGFFLTQMAIEIKLEAFKKALEKTDFFKEFNVEFSDYHYVIYDVNSLKTVLKLPYGRFITSSNRKQIIKTVMYEIIDFIKSLTT